MGRGWVKKERGSVWEIATVKLRMWETKIEGIITLKLVIDVAWQIKISNSNC